MEEKKSTYAFKIKLNAKETKIYIENAMISEMKKISVPGFRKGKVPKNIFLQKYGIESVYPTAVDNILNTEYPKLIEKNEIKVIAQPEINWDNMKISESGFEVEGVVDIMPEFELGDYEAIKKSVKKDKTTVTKKEIKEVIDNELAKDSTYEVKEGSKASMGDMLVIDFEGFVDAEAFEGGKGEDYSLTLGSNTFIPGFEEQLVDSKVGDKKDVIVTFPKEYQAENLKGKEAVFKCEIKEIKHRKLPRLTVDKIKSFEGYEAKTKEELESAIEKKLQEQKELQVNQKYESEFLKKLVKKISLTIPNSMIEQETNSALENLKNNFKQQQIELDMYLQMTGMTLEGLKEQLNVESKYKLEKQLIIEKMVESQKPKVTKKEIDEKIEELSKMYSMKKEELLKQLGGTTDPIKRDIEFEKANDILFK